MPDVLLISADYVKRYTNINDAVEDISIYPSVTLAQEKHLQAYLGTRLYDKIIIDTADGSISGDYLTLRNDYIQRALLWWSMVELYPNLYVRLDNGGLVIRTSEDSTTISESQYNRVVDSERDNAQAYTDKLVRYLCTNASLFPEYNTYDSGDLSPDKKVYPTFEISRRNE